MSKIASALNMTLHLDGIQSLWNDQMSSRCDCWIICTLFDLLMTHAHLIIPQEFKSLYCQVLSLWKNINNYCHLLLWALADIRYHWFYTLLDILLLPLMNPGVVKHHQQSCKVCHFYSKHYGVKLHHPVTKIIIYIIKIIWLLLLIIFIIVIIITIINITQFKIPNSVIHWCQATTGCPRKPNKILSFLHISSTFLSIVAELISANFWMRLIDLFTLICFKLPFSH